MIFDIFDLVVCCVFVFFVLLGFAGKKIISICDGQAHTDDETLHRNLHLYEKAKQNLEILDGILVTRLGLE